MDYEYTLTDGRGSAPLQLYAVQGESGARTYEISLRTKNGQSAVGASDTAYAYVAKNDGTLVVIDCIASAGKVQFTLPLQACTCPGYNKVYIQILGTDTETRFDNMVLFVEPCDLENAVASTDDLGPLANIITDPDYLTTLENAYTTATNQLTALMDAFSPAGEYNATTTYHKFNVISHEGSSYVALQDVAGVEPPNSTYYQLLASRGEQGVQGAQGLQGPPGEAGPQGPQGEKGLTGDTGPQGQKGDPGTGLELTGGPYDNLAALQQAVPSPANGACYLVGTAEPYDVYSYLDGRWTNLGPIQGAQGPEGPQGQQGPAATITVGSVTTGGAGTQASVTNSGTTSAAVLDFVIPQGDTGPQGPEGPQGPQGPQGPAGQSGISTSEVIALVYPVGSIYTSVNNVNPGTFLAGTTWEPFAEGRMLVGVDTTQSEFEHVEQEGGEIVKNMQHTHPTGDHVLTLDEMASHTHGIYLDTQSNTHAHSYSHAHGPGQMRVVSDGSHYHGVTYRNGTTPVTLDPGSSGYRLEWVADSGSGNNENIRTTEDGAHTHGLLGTTSTFTGETGDDTHSHRISGTTDPMAGSGGGAAHNHGDTGVGGSMNFSVLNPYITVYFWKRTA